MLNMILKDLRISPLRNILTGISMFVGIIAMISSVLVGTLGKEYLISVNAQMYGWSPTYSFSITGSDFQDTIKMENFFREIYNTDHFVAVTFSMLEEITVAPVASVSSLQDMQRHNEMIKEIEAKDLILRAGELEKKYPGLNRICRDLKKYEYADKEYQIVVPEKVDDILYEAKLMHHCVNNTETYYERMSQQESYILFLRKAEQPTEAYYTLEVEPDGTIRQTRTFYNQQNEDIELARDFLVKWQKQLKKKLAKEDYKLAVKSQSLRKKEIDELRSKGVRVNGVGYCNKLLAEILEEDLMEAGNRELEEQAA